MHKNQIVPQYLYVLFWLCPGVGIDKQLDSEEAYEDEMRSSRNTTELLINDSNASLLAAFNAGLQCFIKQYQENKSFLYTDWPIVPGDSMGLEQDALRWGVKRQEKYLKVKYNQYPVLYNLYLKSLHTW